jgi:hypothetical protein
MGRRAAVELGSILWAITATAVAAQALPDVNADARMLVGLASVIFPLCAFAAALELRRRADRLAGLLLTLSVATPTYFDYVLNLPALIVGLALVAVPSVTLGDRQEDVASAV